MILGYRDKRTTRFAEGDHVAAFSGFKRAATKALDRLEAANALKDLQTAGLHLEKLKADRDGQFSIRINMQWRICFRWSDGESGPSEVEIVDYH